VRIIYDSHCPLCSNYVQHMKLEKAVQKVQLISARDLDDPFVKEAAALGYNLNKGMLMEYGGTFYFGSDCMNMLALLSSKSDCYNKICAAIFKHNWLARLIYPFLKLGRRVLLFILRRAPI